MAGRPVGVAPFGNSGVLVVCDDGTAWYMASPNGVWFRQMSVPGVPTSAPAAAGEPTPAPAPSAGGWTKTPPFPVPDDISPDKLPPGVSRQG